MPRDTLEPLCVAPVPQDPKNVILGTFWEHLGTPFGALLRLILVSGPVLDAFWGHVGGILGPFGRLSV